MAEKKSFLNRSLDFIERVGNLLPHPVTLFAGFALVIVIASGISATELKAENSLSG